MTQGQAMQIWAAANESPRFDALARFHGATSATTPDSRAAVAAFLREMAEALSMPVATTAAAR